MLVSLFSLALLAACQGNTGTAGKAGEPGLPGLPGVQGPTGPQGPAGEPGAPGNPGVPGNPGHPGNPGLQGLKGDTGAKGAKGATGAKGSAGIAPHASVSVSSSNIYLDGPLTISGAGFGAEESIALFISGDVAVYLGQVSADANGAFTKTFDRLSATKVVANNAAALKAATVLTISAEGVSGGKATTVATASGGGAFSGAVSLSAGSVRKNGSITITGAGFDKGETVDLFAITSYGDEGPVRSTVDRATASDGGAFSKSVTITLDPGIYTLEGFGSAGNVGTAALVVTATSK